MTPREALNFIVKHHAEGNMNVVAFCKNILDETPLPDHDLKPCPFCGADAEATNNYGTPMITCADNCSLGMMDSDSPYLDEISNKWNTRSTDKEIEDLKYDLEQEREENKDLKNNLQKALNSQADVFKMFELNKTFKQLLERASHEITYLSVEEFSAEGHEDYKDWLKKYHEVINAN